MTNPHMQQKVQEYGCSIEEAEKIVLLIHGRGQEAYFMYENVVRPLDMQTVAYLAPQASENSWYPMGFMAEFADNQPWLDHTLECIDEVVKSILNKNRSPEELYLVGFSQGACVACEYLLRHPRNYGGVAAFTGGLIGPAGTEWKGEKLDNTPVLLCTSDIDPWIPLSRAEESQNALSERGASVNFRVYKSMEHIINSDEIALLKDMLV